MALLSARVARWLDRCGIDEDRRGIALALIATASLEVASRLCDTIPLPWPYGEEILSLLEVVCMGWVVRQFLAKITVDRVTVYGLYGAIGLLFANQFLKLTSHFPSISEVAIFGKEGNLHYAAGKFLEPVGLTLLFGGVLFTGIEIFKARDALAKDYKKLAAQLRVEEELRTIEEKLRCVFDSLRDFVLTVTPDGIVLSINHVREGLSVDEMIGASLFDYVPKTGLDTVRSAIAGVCATGVPSTYEVDGSGDNGSLAHYSCRIGPLFTDGKVSSLVIVATDISELRSTQAALMSVVKGTSGDVGDKFYHSLVRHLAEALGVRYALVGRLSPETDDSLEVLALWDGEGFQDDICYPLKDTPCANVFTHDICIYPSDIQSQFPRDDMLVDWGVESYVGSPLRDASGNTLGIVNVMDDKPLADPELVKSILGIFAQRAGAELERQHAEEVRGDLEAQVQYAQKLESLGVLAGGIAHDFNNLLVAMLGFSGLARESVPEDSPALEHLDEIDIAARRAADLTQQMLAYSGKGSFMVEECDIGDLVGEMVQLLHASISKKATLSYSFGENLPILGDVTQIRQIIMNLITNASDAIGDHPGEIALSTTLVKNPVTMDVEDCFGDPLPPGDYVCIEVSDTGEGMDAERRKRMFDPFYTTKFTGRGLGLAAVLGIVRGHGGAIAVSSAPGEGTTIRTYFPVASTPVSKDNGASVVPIPRSGPKDSTASGTVLFADDESYIRDLARRVLEKAGYTVLDAVNGEDAVDVFRAHADEIDAVVLDLTMPQKGGDEAYREIRDIRSDARVILSSGYTEEDTVGRQEWEGLDGFLQKPYFGDTLVDKVRDVMGVKKS